MRLFSDSDTDDLGSRVLRSEVLALVCLTAVAALLRLWRIGEIPTGFHVDEAFNLIDAREVIAGWRPIFLPANAGREALYTYLQAMLLGLFGDSLPVARTASAIAGTLAVPATWLAAREFAPVKTSPRRVALLAAAFIAGSYWHVHFSRFGIRAILFTPVVALAMWAWWRAVRVADSEDSSEKGRSRGWAIFAGALLGLATYVHPAGRGLFVVPLIHSLFKRVVSGDRKPLLILPFALGAMLFVAAPVIWFWIAHPTLFVGHAGEVSILGGGAGVLLTNTAKVLGLFNVAGDPARWRNLPGRPAFDAAVGLAFLFGIVHALRTLRRGDGRSALTLIWLGVLLVPAIVTDAAPNFSRAIGALPAACVLAGIGP